MRTVTTSALLASLSLALCAGCAPIDTDEEMSPVGGMVESPEPLEPPGEHVRESSEAISVGNTTGCSTGAVHGLSLQIIAQGNCLSPGAYVEIPKPSNVTLGSTVVPFMQEPARNALAAALSANPSKAMQINSMLRTIAAQYLLYKWYLAGQCGIQLAAKPGTSNHETGLAIDIQQYATWQTALEAQGFKWLGSSDVVHYDYKGAGTKDLKAVQVKAFQQLWNYNNPTDLLVEDGSYGPQTEARLKLSPAEGFAKTPTCGGPVTTTPDIYLSTTLDDATDAFSDGSSAGVLDVYEGVAQTIRLVVRNQGTAVASGVEIGVALENFSASDYLIESDWGHAGTFATNDANDDPGNPPHAAAFPASATLKLNAISPNETKRVTLYAANGSYSIGQPAESAIKLWARDIKGRYHQDSYDGAITGSDASQTFNGGKLQVGTPVDVFSRTHWEFDGGTREGWTAMGDATLTPDAAKKALQLEAGSGDPSILGPLTSFPAFDYGTITLVASRSGGTGATRVFFTTEAEPALSIAKSVLVDLPDDGQPHTIAVDMTTSAEWTGTITSIGLTPFKTGPGSVSIDAIRAGEWEPPTSGAGGGGAAGGAGGGSDGVGGGGASDGAGGGGADVPEDEEAGCSCSVPGASRTETPGALGLIGAALAMIALGRRRR